MIAMMTIAVSCNNETKKEGPGKGDGPEGNEAAIAIDGKFDDWSKVSGAAIAVNSPESRWTGVNEIRVYAEGDQIFYYVRYDKETIADLIQGEELPLRLNFNTDGEFTTGYGSYFNQAYDFMTELSVIDGSGNWGDAMSSTLYQRIDGSWSELAGPGSGLTIGAGAGREYEIAVDRTIFNRAANASTVPMPMGDTFQTSMRFYDNGWGELSNMPNDPDTENGYGDLLEITFVK